MKRLIVILALFAVACGPRVSDKDKPGSSMPGNNTSPNNAATNNGSPNNVAPNNASPNNTSPNNTSPNNTSPNNTNPNNTNPNNTNPNNTNPNNTNPNNTVPPDIVATCATACELLWGNCANTRCSFDTETQNIVDDIYRGCLGTGGDPADLCTARYQNEPSYRDRVDELVAENNCNGPEIELTHCATFGTDSCNCPLPDLGDPCTSDAQCDGGLLTGGCQPEDAGQYPGGQCLAGGCLFDDEPPDTLLVGSSTLCGDMGICYVVDNTSSVCLPRCFTNSDCSRGVTGANQSGYACSPLGTLENDGGFLGYCDTACGDANPCEDGYVCNANQACTIECFFDDDCPLDFSCTGTTGDNQMYCEYSG